LIAHVVVNPTTTHSQLLQPRFECGEQREQIRANGVLIKT